MKERDSREVAGAWTRFQRHGEADPGPVLAPFVSHFWSAEWSYDVPDRQVVPPSLGVHLSVRPGRAPEVHGVATRHGVVVLEGADSVVGAAFRPGGFRPFLRRSVAELTDAVVGVDAVPGLSGTPDEPAGIPELRRWLEAAAPARDRDAEWVAETVATIVADRALTRVDQLALRHGWSTRTLQRRFAEYVGVGPKWVIRRCRLLEVTRTMAEGPVDWAALAAELGFADQAHLARDFTAMFGEPLTHYAARY